MKDKTCRDYITEVLRKAGINGMAGGTLESMVHDISMHKASTVSRVARLMYNNRELDRKEVNGFVWYRLRN